MGPDPVPFIDFRFNESPRHRQWSLGLPKFLVSTFGLELQTLPPHSFPGVTVSSQDRVTPVTSSVGTDSSSREREREWYSLPSPTHVPGLSQGSGGSQRPRSLGCYGSSKVGGTGSHGSPTLRPPGTSALCDSDPSEHDLWSSDVAW